MRGRSTLAAGLTASTLVTGTGACCPLSFARYLVMGAGGHERWLLSRCAVVLSCPPTPWLSLSDLRNALHFWPSCRNDSMLDDKALLRIQRVNCVRIRHTFSDQ